MIRKSKGLRWKWGRFGLSKIGLFQVLIKIKVIWTTARSYWPMVCSKFLAKYRFWSNTMKICCVPIFPHPVIASSIGASNLPSKPFNFEDISSTETTLANLMAQFYFILWRKLENVSRMFNHRSMCPFEISNSAHSNILFILCSLHGLSNGGSTLSLLWIVHVPS